MVEAYILIEIETGIVQSAVKKIKEIKEIEKAEIVTGKYDIIAKARVEEPDDLLKIVAGKIQELKGVKETMTCIAT